MNSLFNALKDGLSMRLIKQGSSLEKLEEVVASEVPDKVKLAALGAGVAAMVKSAPELFAATALLGGAVGGYGLHHGTKLMDKQDAKHDHTMDEITRLERATKRLRAEYGV